MSTLEHRVTEHYSLGSILSSILTALQEMGKDINSLQPADLAPVDEFHTRGRESTLELVERAEFTAGMRVLDIGCGLGGSARHIAFEHDCQVTGVDLTDEYIRVAEELTALVGLSDKATFMTASALDLPFDDQSFDVVWTEHTQMNIEDKAGFYREIARVLRADGRLVFHDIFLGPAGDPQYPTPWAQQASLSALATPDAIKTAIKDSGLKLVDWVDMSEYSLHWFQTALSNVPESGPPPLGLHLLMGETARTKFNNVAYNLEGRHIVIVQGVAVRQQY